MLQRTLRTTLGLLAASAMLFGGVSTTAAYADDPNHTVARADGIRVPAAVAPMDSGNNGASVTGVGFCGNINVGNDCWTWINTTNGTPCPSGHFCIYTNVFASEGGKVFSFYHCRNGGSDWALQGWNGTGLWDNNNTGGAHGYLKNVNHSVLLNTAPGQFGTYNFVPVWFVQAC